MYCGRILVDSTETSCAFRTTTFIFYIPAPILQRCSRIFITATSSCIVMWQAGFIHRFAGEKSNLDQSQLAVGVSVSPHLTAAVSAPHDVTRCSALQQKRAKMLWKQDCSISESEPTKTPHLLQALVRRFNANGFAHLHAGSAVFFLSPLVHFPLLFIIRAHLPSF